MNRRCAAHRIGESAEPLLLARQATSEATEVEATGEAPHQGLRERKKAKTRALIQRHAIHLFRAQGYDETSIEQIAEAAEVSPSTVFRYFPTKPDLVIYDNLDEQMLEVFRALPPDLPAVQALREALQKGFGAALREELPLQRERERLMREVPELRSRMLDEFMRTLEEIAQLVAERSGLPPSDDNVLLFAGAVLGATLAAWFAMAEDDSAEGFLERIDKGLEALETGFHL